MSQSNRVTMTQEYDYPHLFGGFFIGTLHAPVFMYEYIIEHEQIIG